MNQINGINRQRPARPVTPVRVVKNGVGASQAAMGATRGLAIAANLANATQVVDQTVQLSQNWDKLSNGERAIRVLNIGFWAGMTGALMRAGQIGATPNNGFERVQNPPVMSSFEGLVANVVKAGEVVNYRVTPIYDGPGMPASVVIQTKGLQGLDFEHP